MNRVLVAGATGRLGKPVALHLRQAGYEVRALTRQPERCDDLRGAGIDVMAGDVTRAESLSAAMAGCDFLYVSLRGQNDVASYERSEVQGMANLLEAAKAAGVQRVAYLSGAGKSAGNERHFPVRIKSACEHLLERGSIPYTIFRATHFMESLPMFVRGSAAEILGNQPHRYHYIAANDYARMVAKALREPAAANRAFTIFGPQAYTMREALHVYLDRVHPGMKIRVAPLPVLRVIARLSRNRDLLFATELFAAFADLGEEGDPRPANEILGAATTTLEQWSMSAS